MLLLTVFNLPKELHINAYSDPITDSVEESLDAVFCTFPQLETENLLLRRITTGDADALFEIFSDDEVTRHYDLYSYGSLDEVYQLVEFFDECFEMERGIRWGIAQKTNNRLIGTCGYVWLRQFRGEIGYELNRSYWRQGIMREALPAILHFGYTRLRLNRIEALVMTENKASAGLLDALDFCEEGLLREHDFFKDQFHDMRCFAQLKRDFDSIPNRQSARQSTS